MRRIDATTVVAQPTPDPGDVPDARLLDWDNNEHRSWLRDNFGVPYSDFTLIAPELLQPVFVDIYDSRFVEEIAWMKREGVTTGCDSDGSQFCPRDSVTRGQMASFLVRALDLRPSDTDHFDHDETSVHEWSIKRSPRPE